MDEIINSFYNLPFDNIPPLLLIHQMITDIISSLANGCKVYSCAWYTSFQFLSNTINMQVTKVKRFNKSNIFLLLIR